MAPDMRRPQDLVQVDPRKEAHRESTDSALLGLRKQLKVWAKQAGITLDDDYDPRLELAKLAHNPALPMQLRVQCHSEVAGFFYPKVKALELSLPEGTEMTIRIVKYGKNTDNDIIDVTPKGGQDG